MNIALKAAFVGLLAMGLSGCDSGDTKASSPQDKPAVNVNLLDKGHRVTVLDGKLSFTVPATLTNRDGQFSGQTNNMQIFADDSGRKNVVTLVSDAGNSDLQVLIEALAGQYQNRDGNARVIIKQAADFAGLAGWRLDVLSHTKGQAVYNAILMAIVDDRLVTIQIAMPGGSETEAKATVEAIIASIALS